MGQKRKRKGEPVHGWLNFNKPLDITSTQALGKLKWLFKAQKAGHGGTLDPLADGVLPIAFGEATKTAQWAMDCDKEYVFTVAWGARTATLDREGETIAQSDHRPCTRDIEAVLCDFIGRIDQIPPKYSAIKIDGERAYDLARDGTQFDIPSRQVDVYDLALVDQPDADHAVFRVESGKGFYVRALARDLALALGTEGHVHQLRRTRVGPMQLSDAVSLEALEALGEDMLARRAHLLPLQSVLDDVPQIDIRPNDASDIRHGREIIMLPHMLDNWQAQRDAETDDRVTLSLCDGEAVALGEVRAGRFKPQRVFQFG